jgi:SAM-dependent methyltransferase
MMDIGINYTNDYNMHARDIFGYETDIIFNRIIRTLQSNYRAVDIGSNSGDFARRVMKENCSGIYYSVDPFPQHDEVVNYKGEEYIKTIEDNSFDFITCHYCIHFISNLSDFFYDCYKTLKHNGFMYIITLSKQSLFPWTDCIHKHFVTSCIDIDEFIYDKFVINKETFSKKISIKYDNFVNVIVNRALSNLYNNTDEELNSCIQQLPIDQDIIIDLKYYIYTLQKKN